MKGYIPSEEDLAKQSLGHKIKYYRLQAGLTQKQLAASCGLNESTIRNYELDNRTPDSPTLKSIASVLSINEHALMNTDLSSVSGAVHILFDLEKIYGLRPEMIEGKPCLVISEERRENTSAENLEKAISDWYNALDAFRTEGNKEAYLSWQAAFPETDPLSKK